MGKVRTILAAALLACCWHGQSHASVIDFTGGTVTHLDTTTALTSNGPLYSDVDYYEENGFRYDFLPNSGSGGFSSWVGTYYGVPNDVIHAHWLAGGLGGITTMTITKVGGGPFDLNYFVLTSNTNTGGGPADGSELAYVQGFSDAAGTISTGAPVLLPSQDWGFATGGPFPGVSTILLGSAFDAVQVVKFFVTSPVDCFGMDEFYIDEPAPVDGVPEATSLVTWSLLGGVGLGVVWYCRRSPVLVG